MRMIPPDPASAKRYLAAGIGNLPLQPNLVPFGGSDKSSATAVREMAFNYLSGIEARWAAAAYAGLDIPGGYAPSAWVDPTIATGVVDTIPGDINTPFTISIGGTANGMISGEADQDYFSVTLQAGTRYSFTLNGVGSNGSAALADPLLNFYNGAGVLLASNDDYIGLNSHIIYDIQTTGTYFVGAAAYQSPTTDNVGGYALRVTSLGASPVASPLDSLNWGTQVTPVNGVVNVYFAQAGETIGGETASASWSAYEIQQAMLALQQFSNVINVTFAQTLNSGDAHFRLVQNAGTGALGSFVPPGGSNSGNGWFSNVGQGWTTEGLAQGGYGFITVVHEFGHGMGLAHPHDNGGSSTIMAGVTTPFGSYGTGNLNQGVFTTMSYNDGWILGPSGNSSSNAYGWTGTLSPLDIASLQQDYGANTAFNAASTGYFLPQSNVAGTFYSAIWDGGGLDYINHSGAANSVIDLRPATLLQQDGGGGYVSYVSGVHGGFTIAAGTVIENGYGGTGNDLIIGNDAVNTLLGRSGQDTLRGGLGDDVLLGGSGADSLVGDGGVDIVAFSDALSAVHLSLLTGGTLGDAAGDTYDSIEVVSATEFGDFVDGDAAANGLYGYGGNDTLNGMGGIDLIMGGEGDDHLDGGADGDFINGENGRDTLLGGTGNDVLYGGDLDDSISGGSDIDYIDGGGGNDTLVGGSENDVIIGGLGNDSIFAGANDDYVTDDDGNDTIFGGDGIDALFGGIGNDSIMGEAGSDYLVGGAGIDRLFGGTGDDGILGGLDGDIIDGSDGVDYIRGEDGDDIITGGNDGDYLYGDIGNDTISGDLGTNYINGGAGLDSVVGGNNDEVLLGGAGNDTMSAFGGNDLLLGEDDNDSLSGGDGNDRLEGNNGNDTLRGEASTDYLYGDLGTDLLFGDAGIDLLFGGDDNDTMQGGLDSDYLTGGAGSDRFVFDASWGSDVVNDWTSGVDQIDMTALAGSGVHSTADFQFFNVVSGSCVIGWNGNFITFQGYNAVVSNTDFLFA